MFFKNRQDAGKKLAAKLKRYKDTDSIVVALPRGGVGIAYEIARLLHLSLRVLIVRKIGSPYNPEYAIGAVTSGGVAYLDQLTVHSLGISQEEIELLVRSEMKEVEHREEIYNRYCHLGDVKKKTIILVDDGLATGATVRAAILRLQKLHPQKIILAVPGAPTDTAEDIKLLVDAFYTLTIEDNLGSVGMLYEEFPQMTDERVLSLLNRAENGLK